MKQNRLQETVVPPELNLYVDFSWYPISPEETNTKANDEGRTLKLVTTPCQLINDIYHMKRPTEIMGDNACSAASALERM